MRPLEKLNNVILVVLGMTLSVFLFIVIPYQYNKGEITMSKQNENIAESQTDIFLRVPEATSEIIINDRIRDGWSVTYLTSSGCMVYLTMYRVAQTIDD